MRRFQLNKALLKATFENPPFDDAETSALLLKVPGALSPDTTPEEFKLALNDIICNYAFDRYQQHQASDASVAKSAMQIVQACGTILSVAGFADDRVDPEELASGLGEGALFAAAALRGEERGRAAIMNSFNAVRVLMSDAQVVADRARMRAKVASLRNKKGPPPDKARDKTVGLLADLYQMAWGRSPTVSRSSGVGGGDFVTLLTEFFAVARRHGLDDRVRTSDQLAKVWERCAAYEDHKAKGKAVDE